MHTKIVAIGTSKGIRIPKYLLEKYNLKNIVEVDDTGTGLLIHSVKQPREGWAEAFNKVANSQHDVLIEMPKAQWDDEEWEW